MTINTERLAQVTTLKSGSHKPNDDAGGLAIIAYRVTEGVKP